MESLEMRRFFWPYSASRLRKRLSDVLRALELPQDGERKARQFDLWSLRAGGATWLLASLCAAVAAGPPRARWRSTFRRFSMPPTWRSCHQLQRKQFPFMLQVSLNFWKVSNTLSMLGYRAALGIACWEIGSGLKRMGWVVAMELLLHRQMVPQRRVEQSPQHGEAAHKLTNNHSSCRSRTPPCFGAHPFWLWPFLSGGNGDAFAPKNGAAA